MKSTDKVVGKKRWEVKESKTNRTRENILESIKTDWTSTGVIAQSSNMVEELIFRRSWHSASCCQPYI